MGGGKKKKIQIIFKPICCLALKYAVSSLERTFSVIRSVTRVCSLSFTRSSAFLHYNLLLVRNLSSLNWTVSLLDNGNQGFSRQLCRISLPRAPPPHSQFSDGWAIAQEKKRTCPPGGKNSLYFGGWLLQNEVFRQPHTSFSREFLT